MASHPDCTRTATSADATFRPSASKLPRTRWLTTLLVLGSASLWPGDRQAWGQTRKPAATLVVFSQLQLKPGQEAPLEIAVAPGDAIPPRSVIVVRGVPQGVKLSAGSPFGPGVWVFPAAQLTSVKLQVPPEARVSGVLTLALTTLEGTALAEAHVTLLTAPAAHDTEQKSAAAAPAGAYDSPTSATGPAIQGRDTPPQLAPDHRAELLVLLDKGVESFRLGNILHARAFYLRAAERGLPEAAFALAATYDPVELSRMKAVVGVVPDAELAMKWYEKARQLGSPDAAARLAALARP